MIDIKARERIINERGQKSLISQLVASLKPPDKPDTTTEPLNKVVEGIHRGGNISTILVAFVQGIFKTIKELKDSSPSRSDVQEVKTAVQGLVFPEVHIPETVTLNPTQQEEIVSTVKGIKFPEPKDFPQTMDVGVGELADKLDILEEILSTLEKNKVSEVKGTVDIRRMPELNVEPVVKAIKELRLNVPKNDSKVSAIDFSEIVSAINELNDNILSQMQPVKFPKTISVDNFPTQYIPPTVTHFSINSLQGVVKTTALTVSTSATELPSSALDNRRSIQVYNNSTNTLYIGGSDVTTSNGIPVPPSSFSQALDMGQNMVLYGIATGSSNIRVLEISDEASGR